MQNTKTITFDFFFSYSTAGGFTESNQITVVEPAYDRRDVYNTMRGYLGEAAKLLAKHWAGMPRRQDATPAPAVEEETVAKPQEDDDPDGDGLMEQMRFALGVQGYVDFCDYVSRKLTNDRKLAFIGNADLPENERVPVQPVHWEAIAAAGGLKANDLVLARFVSFFEPQDSPKKKTVATTNGSTPSLPPAQSPPARSRSKTPSA